MKIEDFAELQSRYTGASNKRKWIITHIDILSDYFKKVDYRPGELAKQLGVSYSTTKRFLCSAGLWNLAKIKEQKNYGGRKRTAFIDKFGYLYASSEHDFISSNGETIRRSEHHVVAEQKIGRKLKESEVVHHIDLNKQNNHPDNLHVCADNSEHRLLHCSLETEAAKLVRSGVIKFHPEHGYYLDDKIGVVSKEEQCHK